MSSSFIVPRHATDGMLRKMLKNFRSRLERQCGGGEQAGSRPREMVTRELLESMVKTLNLGEQTSSSSYATILYWPLTKESFNNQLCLYKEAGAHDIHLVLMPDLIAKVHPWKNHYRRCACIDHAQHLRFDWREFIYPQFVQLLYAKLQLPSACPSPSTKDAHCITNETLQFTMEIDKSATFLTHAGKDLFRLPCQELSGRYKNRHLAAFGKENIEEMCHFEERKVTEDNYKLIFKLNNAKIRATEILGGGSLCVKPTSADEPYVVIASNFYLVPGSGTPHYRVHVLAPSLRHSILADHRKKRIKSTKLCGANQLCMIVSSAPLRLEFKAGWPGSFTLTTPSACSVVLHECRLALWTKDHKHAWPLKYEIVPQEGFLKSDYAENLGMYYEKIHNRYHALFNEPGFSTAAIEAPAHGYVLFRTEEEVVGLNEHGSICKATVKTELTSHNQYGSMREYDNRGACVDELMYLRVCYREGSQGEPSFWDVRRPDKPMQVVREGYVLVGKTYTLQSLCRRGESHPWCYFFVNRERTYIVFIAL